MTCGGCNNDLQLCICDDIDERIATL